MTIDSLKNTQENIFKIEDALPSDVEAIDNIQKACFLEIYPNENYGITREDILAGAWNSEERLADKRKEIAEMNLGKVHVWVVRDNKNEAVGFCVAHQLDNYGYIERMFILPEFRRKGAGQKLMQRAFEWLGQDLDIRLEVVKYNLDAIDFYKKIGFKENNAEVPSNYGGGKLTNGKEIPRIEMIKKGLNNQ